MPRKHILIKGLITLLIVVISPVFAELNVLDSQDIHSGDLIFREGTEPISDLIVQSEKNTYSHVGMLYKKQNQWFVIHATPPEIKGRADGVVIDPLTFFIAKERSKHYAIYKVKGTAKQHQQALTYTLAELNKPFRLNEKEGTYCTLLIYQSWKKAGVDLEPKFTHITMPLLKGDYILPKDLILSKHLLPSHVELSDKINQK